MATWSRFWGNDEAVPTPLEDNILEGGAAVLVDISAPPLISMQDTIHSGGVCHVFRWEPTVSTDAPIVSFDLVEDGWGAINDLADPTATKIRYQTTITYDNWHASERQTRFGFALYLDKTHAYQIEGKHTNTLGQSIYVYEVTPTGKALLYADSVLFTGNISFVIDRTIADGTLDFQCNLPTDSGLTLLATTTETFTPNKIGVYATCTGFEALPLWVFSSVEAYNLLPDPIVTVDTSSTIGHVFSVEVPVTYPLNPKLTWNHYDEFGLLHSLSRLRGETNWEFRRRLRNTFISIANSTYQGLVNGITRELGLELFDAITICPKRDVSGAFLAAAPNVIFDGVYLTLYSDYDNNLIEFQIDRRSPGGNYETLGLLVDKINQDSVWFTASLLDETHRQTNSSCIFNQSSRVFIQEAVDPTTRFTLQYPFIARNTLYFSDRIACSTEVATQNLVSSIGDFSIDYTTGIVSTKSPPRLGTVVRYEYVQEPFIVRASPIVLHGIVDTNFANQLFEQIIQDDGTYINGIPTAEGIDIINELLSIGKGLYYGR